MIEGIAPVLSPMDLTLVSVLPLTVIFSKKSVVPRTSPQKVPFGAKTSPIGFVPNGTGNSVTVPLGKERRPKTLEPNWVNQIAPSGPVVIVDPPTASGVAKWVSAPDVVDRSMPGPPSVNQTWPSAATMIENVLSEGAGDVGNTVTVPCGDTRAIRGAPLSVT